MRLRLRGECLSSRKQQGRSLHVRAAEPLRKNDGRSEMETGREREREAGDTRPARGRSGQRGWGGGDPRQMRGRCHAKWPQKHETDQSQKPSSDAFVLGGRIGQIALIVDGTRVVTRGTPRPPRGHARSRAIFETTALAGIQPVSSAHKQESCPFNEAHSGKRLSAA
ncbi:unnamed protein product [Lampetra planeri]